MARLAVDRQLRLPCFEYLICPLQKNLRINIHQVHAIAKADNGSQYRRILAMPRSPVHRPFRRTLPKVRPRAQPIPAVFARMQHIFSQHDLLCNFSLTAVITENQLRKYRHDSPVSSFCCRASFARTSLNFSHSLWNKAHPSGVAKNFAACSNGFSFLRTVYGIIVPPFPLNTQILYQIFRPLYCA